MRAFVVLDLGFGDAGKGLITDYLVRRTGARLVVRYNGGAQAGHNVIAPDGRHHTFAQLGSGTFVEGVRTFLSRHVVIHPLGLLLEAAALEGKGLKAPLSRVGISENARVVTPFHQAAGRLREIARGAGRHGSCGVGIGETVRDALSHPREAIRARDLRDRARLTGRARRARERLRAEIHVLGVDDGGRESALFDDDHALETWIEQAGRLGAAVVADSVLAAWAIGAGSVVFEGAQGVLLDEWAGFHPFTTWSRCTLDNALELIGESMSGAAVERVGVLRTHAVRHGPGPLPTETEAFRAAVSDHNVTGPWQGPVRYGWWDAVLARYALDVIGGVDRLVLTHLDAARRVPQWRTCDGYSLDLGADERDLAVGDGRGIVRRLSVPRDHDLARQERRTRLAFRASPRLDECEPTAEAVVRRTEALLDREVDLVSSGARALDVVPPPGRYGARPTKVAGYRVANT